MRKRIEKAEYELSFADRFDIRIINDNLDHAVSEVEKAIREFTAK